MERIKDRIIGVNVMTAIFLSMMWGFSNKIVAWCQPHESRKPVWHKHMYVGARYVFPRRKRDSMSVLDVRIEASIDFYCALNYPCVQFEIKSTQRNAPVLAHTRSSTFSLGKLVCLGAQDASLVRLAKWRCSEPRSLRRTTTKRKKKGGLGDKSKNK